MVMANRFMSEDWDHRGSDESYESWIERISDDAVTFMSMPHSGSLSSRFFDGAVHTTALMSDDDGFAVYPQGALDLSDDDDPTGVKTVLAWNPSVAGNHIDVSLLRPCTGVARNSVRYWVNRIREIPPHMLKGKRTECGTYAKRFKRTFAVYHGEIGQDGKLDAGLVDFLGFSDGRWISSVGMDRKDRALWNFLWSRASIAIGAELTYRQCWRVSIGLDSSPSVSFPTDPLGIREVFRLRDIPNGKSRRAALTHWVREHWRKKREPGASDVAKVREHLRGASEFSWNGLRCRIVPSGLDQERAASNSR